MSQEALLKKMSKDMEILKEKISKIEIEIEEMNEDLHELKPEYLEKLKKIEKQGNFKKYQSVDDLRRTIENV